LAYNIGVEQMPRKLPLKVKIFGGTAHTERYVVKTMDLNKVKVERSKFAEELKAAKYDLESITDAICQTSQQFF
jgi:predicted component of type VI protein secretion system